MPPDPDATSSSYTPEPIISDSSGDIDYTGPGLSTPRAAPLPQRPRQHRTPRTRHSNSVSVGSLSQEPLLRSTRQHPQGNFQTLHRWEAPQIEDRQRKEVAEEDLLSRIQDSIRKAKEEHDEAERAGKAILDLEAEIQAGGGSPTREQLKELDSLYRTLMRKSEAEKRVLDEEDIANNLAILAAMKHQDEPAPRNGTGKSRKNQKQILESDLVMESPSTPTDRGGDMIKRVKGASQRSSSVASQNRTASGKESSVESRPAESLTVGTEVFYKLTRDDNDEGVGQHQIIKKVWQDKKGMLYDLKDPEKGETSRKGIAGRLLAVIPAAGQVMTPVFPNGAKVYARYPDTDTFYEAEVRNYSKGQYALLFEGEEESLKEHMVERRYVFDPSRWK